MPAKQGFKVLVAWPHGFCRGVEMAVEILDIVCELYEPPIFAKHAIVHNDFVIRYFEQKGVVFVEKVSQIPSGSVAVFSAHGSPPSDYQEAQELDIEVIDAACHLVTNVHNWAKRFAKEGYEVIVIGHRNHPEPKGILGNIPQGQGYLVETLQEAKTLEVKDPRRVAAVCQTTLALDETREIRRALRARFPRLQEPALPNSTICYATTNRQTAVKELAKLTKTILVIGSKESSNTKRLREVARDAGAKAYRIDGPEDISKEWLNNVQALGVTSGASVPELLLRQVISWLKMHGAGSIKKLPVLREDVTYFHLRPETHGKLTAKAQEKGVNLAALRREIASYWR